MGLATDWLTANCLLAAARTQQGHQERPSRESRESRESRKALGARSEAKKTEKSARKKPDRGKVARIKARARLSSLVTLEITQLHLHLHLHLHLARRRVR